MKTIITLEGQLFTIDCIELPNLIIYENKYYLLNSIQLPVIIRKLKPKENIKYPYKAVEPYQLEETQLCI